MSTSSTFSPMLAIRAEAARRLGCELESLDPETGYLCELRRGARRKILLGGFSPLNNALAARLAEDKFHTALILARAGLRVPESVRCLKPGRFPQEDFPHTGTEPARRFAARRGLPLVVKPNRGARGRDVQWVDREDDLSTAVRRVWDADYLALVQTPVPGVDVRLDFLDGDYLLGYVRRPLVVRGDGESSLAELIVRADRRYADAGLRRNLAGELDLEAVPAAGEEVASPPILNLNRLATAELARQPQPEWLATGRRAGAELGLRHWGVDLKVDEASGTLAVLEVNASPSLVQISELGHREEALEAEMRVVEAILSG